MITGSKFISSISFSLLLTLAVPFVFPVFSSTQAQNKAQQQALLGHNITDAQRQLRECSVEVREFGRKNGHFPLMGNEQDDFLKTLYSKISMGSADTRVLVKQDGKYRTFYHFAIAQDPSFQSVPIVNGIPQIPATMTGPANSIVILTDGVDDCVGFATNEDGKPISGDGGVLYFSEVLEKKE